MTIEEMREVVRPWSSRRKKQLSHFIEHYQKHGITRWATISELKELSPFELPMSPPLSRDDAIREAVREMSLELTPLQLLED
jgi:hypothetical protein